MREKLIAYCSREYGTKTDRPWHEYPDHEVLRHSDDRKWYGLCMYLPKEKLGLAGHVAPGETMEESDDYIDVVNLKCKPDMIYMLRMSPGILPAYHMNRKNWITVLLDGTVSWEQIRQLLDLSFELTASKAELEKFGKIPPRDWLIPANPKYYDVVHAFDDTDVISWKQGAGVRAGDTIFLYVAAPYSAIMFQCKVLEVNIPYREQYEPVSIKKIMTVQLEKRFDPEMFTFEKLKEHGVYAVRGPRSLPGSLREEIDRLSFLFGQEAE